MRRILGLHEGLIFAMKSTNEFVRDFTFLDRRSREIDYLVVLNRPVEAQYNDAFLQSSKKVVLADGAANHYRKLDSKIKPDFIVGDFDSIDPTTREYFQKWGVPFYGQADQDSTDYEKTMNWVLKQSKGPVFVSVLGALGGRMDHTIQNISSTVRLCRKNLDLDICLLGQSSMMYYLRPGVPYSFTKSKLQNRKGCGVVTFSKAKNVQTSGLKWNMGKEHMIDELEFGRVESTSNEIVQQPVKIYSEGEMFWVTSLLKEV